MRNFITLFGSLSNQINSKNDPSSLVANWKLNSICDIHNFQEGEMTFQY